MMNATPFVKGLSANFAARACWGLAAWYFALAHTNDDELLFFHRLLWAALFCAIVLVISGGLPSVLTTLRERGQLTILCSSSLLIASNWYVVIWCVTHEKVVCASLGFYLAPMVTVMLGHALSKQYVNYLTRIAVLLCAAGVGLIIFSSKGRLEWQALYIAASSAVYALIRKSRPVPTLVANFLECAIPLVFLPPWIAWRITFHDVNASFWPQGNAAMYFVGTGIVTTIPMIFYVYSLDKLPLQLIGYLQYISPSIMFLVGILVFREDVSQMRALGFLLVWVSIGLHVFWPRLSLFTNSQRI